MVVNLLIFARFRGGFVFWQTRDDSLQAKPSLQALRAETMVERFTARMHVCWAFRFIVRNLISARFVVIHMR